LNEFFHFAHNIILLDIAQPKVGDFANIVNTSDQHISSGRVAAKIITDFVLRC
jgi:hypothetical protein